MREQCHEALGNKQKRDGRRYGDHEAITDGQSYRLPRPGFLPCAKILAYEGAGGQRETADRDKAEPFHLMAHAQGGERRRAET